MDQKKVYVAKRPPMGWNSWDCYGASVNEEILLGNAGYMAENLKEFGWKYVVCDIQWYEPTADSHEYHPFVELEMDQYSRLMPAVNRFPSAAGGKGFGPIARMIHEMGLKFGIHILRGIPRQAVHRNSKILGTDRTAKEIASTASICMWNTDMYGVDASKEGAQEYYDSLFELYAQWGVDFVKVDDICRHVKEPFYEKEMIMMARAIERSGRPIVLSLSPGPANIEKAHQYERFANMWRITDDFWDDWKLLKAMFERCEVWQRHTGEGNWPDCDMIPLNVLGWGWGTGKDKKRGWTSKFTKDEARTMITLWSIFRSPLMLGTDLPQLDDFSLSLITNDEILAMNKNPYQAFMSSDSSSDNVVIWTNDCPDDLEYYECYFNVSEEVQTVKLNITIGSDDNIRDLWEHKDLGASTAFELAPHACRAFKIRVTK